jgi:RimJ/RimL family protein N-acetyltransferase
MSMPTLTPAASETFVLRGGAEVLIRPVRPADAGLLAEGFERLSPESRRSRFLTAKDVLRPAELEYLTDVDHHDHEAIGALDLADGRGVGVARYIRDRHDPRTAEIAVTIVDGWQGGGLGTELVARLAERARAEGIERFVALTAGGNVAMGLLLRRMGGTVLAREFGTVEYELDLAGVIQPEPLPRAS